MSARILVTRPEPGASRTAQRLSKAGYDPVVLPLTRIEPLAHLLPAGAFDGVIVTSAQALAAADPAGLSRFLTVPVLAVGETTGQAARSLGFSSVNAGTGSTGWIVEHLKATAGPGARLLYLCGRVRRPELEAALAHAGIAVQAVETYDAVPVPYGEEQLASALGGAPFDAVVLMSRQAASAFDRRMSVGRFGPLFKGALIVCFSTRIAEALRAERQRKAVVTEHASEDALMNLLETAFAV